MTRGTLMTGGARPTVRLTRQLEDPPAEVWEALTDREQLRAWFPCDVLVAGGHWQVGAAITFEFGAEAAGMTLTGEVLVVDEPAVLSFTWGEETLRFELTAHDGGTELVLIDELPPSAAARNAAGWDGCLDRLAGIEPGPGDGDTWRRRFEAYTAAFTPELGPQEGPPAEYRSQHGADSPRA